MYDIENNSKNDNPNILFQDIKDFIDNNFKDSKQEILLEYNNEYLKNKTEVLDLNNEIKSLNDEYNAKSSVFDTYRIDQFNTTDDSLPELDEDVEVKDKLKNDLNDLFFKIDSLKKDVSEKNVLSQALLKNILAEVNNHNDADCKISKLINNELNSISNESIITDDNFDEDDINNSNLLALLNDIIDPIDEKTEDNSNNESDNIVDNSDSDHIKLNDNDDGDKDNVANEKNFVNDDVSDTDNVNNITEFNFDNNEVRFDENSEDSFNKNDDLSNEDNDNSDNDEEEYFAPTYYALVEKYGFDPLEGWHEPISNNDDSENISLENNESNNVNNNVLDVGDDVKGDEVENTNGISDDNVEEVLDNSSVNAETMIFKPFDDEDEANNIKNSELDEDVNIYDENVDDNNSLRKDRKLFSNFFNRNKEIESNFSLPDIDSDER